MSDGFPGADLEWDGPVPRSRLYDDIYFSREDGLAETRAVYLRGCGLPDAWRDRRRFTVAELGFGTGLNIAALLDLWSRTRQPGARLHIFSVEAHPIPREEAARALSHWPQVADASQALLRRWPRMVSGFHRLDLPELGATLDLAVMEVGQALSDWRGAADAWFLDGFSPARNPAMWRPEVIDLVAARSRPGARLATFTVAGSVRRELERVGFTLSRQPGFGGKRERLEAVFPGNAVDPEPPGRIAIVGGGIAGASLKRALGAEGCAATLLRAGNHSASTAPAASVAPRLDAGLGPVARLATQAFHRAVDLYATVADATVRTGAARLETAERDAARFAAIAGGNLFAEGALRIVDPEEMSGLIGEPAPAGLWLEEAAVVSPARLLAAWVGADVVHAGVAGLERREGAWRLYDGDGATLMTADVVILAAGPGTAALLPSLPLGVVRGQASIAAALVPTTPALFGGYALPFPGGVMFGATHDRGDEGLEERPEDHARNRDTLAAALPELAERLAGAPLTAHVGLRVSTPDFLPIAGAVPGQEGLHVLTGLGSRGYAFAPLLAEHAVAEILGAPSPLPESLAALVDPARFAKRAARKGTQRVKTGT